MENDDSDEIDDIDIEVEKIKSRLGDDEIEENVDSGKNVFKGNNVLDIESDDDSEIDFKFFFLKLLF